MQPHSKFQLNTHSSQSDSGSSFLLISFFLSSPCAVARMDTPRLFDSLAVLSSGARRRRSIQFRERYFVCRTNRLNYPDSTAIMGQLLIASPFSHWTPMLSINTNLFLYKNIISIGIRRLFLHFFGSIMGFKEHELF